MEISSIPNKYRVILADPPWSNRDMIVPRPEDRRVPYPVASLKRIASLPVPDLAAQDCHIYCWCMNNFLPHALWLVDYWGFKYYNLLTWVKPDGWGFTWCNRTEHIVFGFKGRLDMRNKVVENVFGAASNGHSRKPEVSYEVIEKASYGPYLELFARRQRPGWDVWGNEVECSPGLDFTI